MSVSISGAGSISGLDQGFNVTTGSVGIGTDAPAAGNKLHLQDTTACRIQLSTNNTGHTSSDGTRLMIDSSNNFEILNREAANIEFFTNNTERLRIASDGKVGINKTPSTYQFEVSGGSANTVASFESTDATSRILFKDNSGEAMVGAVGDALTFYTSTNATERLRIDDVGRVTITGQGLKLSTNNSSLYSLDGSLSYYATNNGVYLNGAGTNGWLRLNASGSENNQNAINIFGGSAGAYITMHTSNVERLKIDSDGTLESYSPDDTTPNIKWRSNDTNWFGSLNQSVEGGTITSFLSCGGDWSANGTTYSATKALAAYPTSAIAIHNQYNSSWGSQFVFLTKAGGSTTTDGAVTESLRITSDGKMGLGETTPLGKLHVKTADSGASSVGASADELVIEGSGHAGMTILSGANQQALINFADPDDVNVGGFTYSHSDNSLVFRVNDAEKLRITSSGTLNLSSPSSSVAAGLLNVPNGSRAVSTSSGGYVTGNGGIVDMARYEMISMCITAFPANNNAICAINGAPIYINDTRDTWSYYSSLPNYLLGTLTHDCINNSSFNVTLACTMTVFMGRSSTWNAVNTSGWNLIESNTGIAPFSSNTRLYVRTLGAGTHTLDNDSAMYFFSL